MINIQMFILDCIGSIVAIGNIIKCLFSYLFVPWIMRNSRPLTRYEGWDRRGLSLVMRVETVEASHSLYEGWDRRGLSLVMRVETVEASHSLWGLIPSRPLTRYMRVETVEASHSLYEGWDRRGLSLVIGIAFGIELNFSSLCFVIPRLCVLQWSLVRGKCAKLLSDAQ